jgi:hypothetical protein
MNSPLESLCCLASNPYPSESVKQQLKAKSSDVSDWDSLSDLVNTNRIGALLYWHHKQGTIQLPKQHELTLLSGFLKNKKVATVRDRWLSLLSAKFNEAGIDHAYLKGTALCHIAYPSPYLRSMDDIDILVDQERNDDVHKILLELGVSSKKPTTARELGCHQWPIAYVWYEGLKFDLEIHTRVLSRRIGGYGVMSQYLPTLVPFEVDGQTRHALSHEDFIITQLYRFKHLTEIFRLIDIADIAGYLERYADQMDWDGIYRQHAWIQHCLAAIDCVTPLSEKVKASTRMPNHLDGMEFDLSEHPYGGLPVNRYLKARGLQPKIPLPKRILNTLAPSRWWMTLVYGCDGSLMSWMRGYLINHPISVLKQLYNAARHK